jgi:hypothetical protein
MCSATPPGAIPGGVPLCPPNRNRGSLGQRLDIKGTRKSTRGRSLATPVKLSQVGRQTLDRRSSDCRPFTGIDGLADGHGRGHEPYASRSGTSAVGPRYRRSALWAAQVAAQPSGRNRPGRNTSPAPASSRMAGWMAAAWTSARVWCMSPRSRTKPGRSWTARPARPRTLPERATATIRPRVSGNVPRPTRRTNRLTNGIRCHESPCGRVSRSQPPRVATRLRRNRAWRRGPGCVVALRPRYPRIRPRPK